MNARLENVIATHFDPLGGAPYWLERERALGFSVRAEIRSVNDLIRLGPFDMAALRTRPYSDFVPRSVRERGRLIFGETGGATGVPATTAYTVEDFGDAFVQPFLDRVDCDNTFTGGHWLWLGPSGPHIIGRAAERIAQLTTGMDPFSIDFDPRWYRRLAPASMARSRYLDHLLEQAGRIIAQQDIRYLFCTPVVLGSLLERTPASARAAIRFVYLGGMAIAGETLAELGAALPQAAFFSGYGNTLFGVTHELRAGPASADVRRYYPAGDRVLIRIVPPPTQGTPDDARLGQDVSYGECGQVVMSRLDPSSFLPNVMERDAAIRLRPPASGAADGLGDPKPPTTQQLTIDSGIY